MNIEIEINKLGFHLMEFLTIEDIRLKKLNEDYTNNKNDFIGATDCMATFKIPVSTPLISYGVDIFDNKLTVSAILDDKRINLNHECYPKLLNIVEIFLSEIFFNKNTNFKFIETAIFEWVIDVYSKGKADVELYTFIENKTNRELSNYTFYFKIYGLIIQQHFTIGNCKFTSLTTGYFEEKFDELVKVSENLTKKNKLDFLSLHKGFIDNLLISVTIKGVKEKAKSQAKKEVELSINAVKCFLGVESLKPNTQLFNVDFNYMNEDKSEYFSIGKDFNSMAFHTTSKNSPSPIQLENYKLKELSEKGLEQVSLFLKNKKYDKLYYEIEHIINALGNLNSTINLYDSVVQLISFFERIIIPKTNKRAKGLSILKKNVLPKLINNLDDNIELKINKIYNVRDKYIHNRIELPINANDLNLTKDIARIFLIRLIKLNSNYSTLEQVHDYYGIPNN